MAVIFAKSKGLTDQETHYCPGCTHGIIQRLVAEVLVEMDLLGDTIGFAAVGCSILAYNYLNIDMIESAHGRAPAVATGVKRVHPKKTVFTYQGDGDLASIGTAEIVHVAHRGEKITTIFVNNAIYGMTGGQIAPATLPGQKVTTAPDGRDVAHSGMPLKVSEMIAQIPGAVYVERVSTHSPGGLLLVNSSLIDKPVDRRDIRVHGIFANELAVQCGMPRAANMVMLGAYLALAKPVKIESITLAFMKVFGAKAERLLAKNIEALRLGAEALAGMPQALAA